MSATWDDVRRELEAVPSARRAAVASEVVRQLDVLTPPPWLREMASSRANQDVVRHIEVERRPTMKRSNSSRELRELDRRLSEIEKGVQEIRSRAYADEIDEAISDGRLARGRRDTWLRHFEAGPELARTVLSELRPNPRLAYENHWDAQPIDPERDLEEKKEIAAAFGIPLEEVV